MSRHSKRSANGLGRVKRFRSNKDGSTAIEFALIAPVFMMIMFSLFEVGWFYYTNSVVDASISDAGRLIKTGQVQRSGLSEAGKEALIFNEVCKALKLINNCQNNLTVEVDTFNNFAVFNDPAQATAPVCPDATEAEQDAIPFEPGGELEIVRVRVCFFYKTVNPAIGINLSEPGKNYRRLISSIIFRNEPYERENEQG
ncbi:MAG: TadE/TadG family type IV pilus assembly protein [Pseudomonadota bacterium]